MSSNLDRPLAAPGSEPKSRGSLLRKAALVALVLLVFVLLVSRVNVSRSMRRLDVGVASGSKEGNYHAIVDDLAALAKKDQGTIRNVESAGSMDNVARLERAASGSCDVAFALAQDGSDWGKSGKLELVARLPKAESVFFVGKGAGKLTTFAQLDRMKIGVGPEGSGVSRLARQILELPDFAGLGLSLQHHPLAEQLAMAERGELDLAVLVMDEDAPLVVKAVRDQNLQIAPFAHVDVIARRVPHLRTGRIGAGQYEAVRLVPPIDTRVLRVETLIVGNRCAGRSATIDLLMVLSKRFPELVKHNKDAPGTQGLELSSTSRGFFEHGGPEIADEYVPWLVDVMPPANWAYVVMGISLLFNAMGAGHRFRLWRIDDARVKLEDELTRLFGSKTTLGDIARLVPDARLRSDEVARGIESLVTRFEALAARSRRQSLSMLVPMGQEMAYRYQEEIIYETLAVLRDFQRRAADAKA